MTADNMTKKGYKNHSKICHLKEETADHLHLNCSFSKQVWELCIQRAHMPAHFVPNSQDSLINWWDSKATVLPQSRKEQWNCLVILVCWKIWLERNNRAFNKAGRNPNNLFSSIVEEARDWSTAGIKGAEVLLPPNVH
jgi:hypothetical protein